QQQVTNSQVSNTPMRVCRVHPKHLLGLLNRLDVQVHRHGLAVAAAQHAFQHLGGAGVDFLMGHVGWHVDEIAGAGFGGEFELFAPAHAGAALDHVDHAFQRPVVVGTGLGVGVDGHGSGPQFLGAHACKVDGSLAVHAGGAGHVAVELVAGYHAHAVVLPGGVAGGVLAGRVCVVVVAGHGVS